MPHVDMSWHDIIELAGWVFAGLMNAGFVVVMTALSFERIYKPWRERREHAKGQLWFDALMEGAVLKNSYDSFTVEVLAGNVKIAKNRWGHYVLDYSSYKHFPIQEPPPGPW